MAIKNRDGTPYVPFSSHPPQMEKQLFWNEKVIKHNKFGQRYVQTVEVVEVPKEIAIKFPPKEKDQEIKIVESRKEEAPVNITDGLIDVWCLPCVSVIDGKPNYGEKFIFQAQLIETEDLFIQLAAQDKIPEQSVIFPKINMKRHWRVKAIKQIEDFYLLYAIISDYQPSFSL